MMIITLPEVLPESGSQSSSVDEQNSGGGQFTEERLLVGDLFGRIGAVQWLPEKIIDKGAVLCSATIALFATLIEAVAASDGAVTIDSEGEELKLDALGMAAQAVRGAAELLLDGETPEEIRTDVATPGGVTRKGLDAMEQWKVSEGMKEAMAVISVALDIWPCMGEQCPRICPLCILVPLTA